MSDQIEIPPDESPEEIAESPEIERVELDETTVEPEATVERSGDIAEAEAIEEAVVQAVEAIVPASEEHVEMEGIRADTDKPPVEVELKLEPSATAEPILEERERSIEEQPDEETKEEFMGYVNQVEGSAVKAEVGTHDLGPEEIERKIRTEWEGESEPSNILMDFKPIPADELDEGVLDRKRPGMETIEEKGGEVSLDRKGDDKPVLAEMGDQVSLDRKGGDQPLPNTSGDEVTLERKGDDGPALDGKGTEVSPDMKFIKEDPSDKVGKITGPSFREELLDEEILKLDTTTDEFKVEQVDGVIPKLEVEAGGVDFKFFRPAPSEGGIEPPEDVKDPAYLQGEDAGVEVPAGHANLESILGRAVIDSNFRERLAQDIESIIGEYNLAKEELDLLAQIDPQQLVQMVSEVQARFAESTEEALQAAQGSILAELLWGSDREGKSDADEDGGVEHHDSWKGE